MDQKQVEIVLSVAKYLSFSEAAWETAYAASVVSKQVASLEKELGVRLFERRGRSKVSLTELGAQLLPSLACIQAEYEKMRGSIAAAAQKTITLICPRGFSTLGEDELISIFCTQYPDVEVTLIEGSVEDCHHRLMSGDVDLATRMLSVKQLQERYLSLKDLSYVKLSENHIGVVLQEHHPAIRGGRADLKLLRDETFVFRAFDDKMEDDPKVQAFREACRLEGFEPKIQFQRSMRASAVFALAAKGVCVVPSMRAPNVLYPGTTYALFSKNYYTFTVTLLYRSDNTSQTVKNFVKCARENAQVFASPGRGAII